jgi:hypothetical protein
MPLNPLEKVVMGGLLAVAGLVLIIVRKDLREADENWNARVPWFLQSFGPHGTFFEVLLIIFGAFLLFAGIVNPRGRLCSILKILRQT